MSAKTFIHILRRFFATTAYPRWIVCDSSKTFKAIAELHGSFRTETGENSDITDYCAQRKIEFKFIPSYSPWQGGLYEKMIHIFKVSFKHALNNRQLKIQELLTIAKESEAMVNSCPLTYVSEENHVPTLRPIDFLRPWTSISIPRLSEPEREWTPKTTTKEQLIHVWNTTNDMLNRFWKRWCSEYFTSLREQYRTTHPHPRCFNESAPKKNDIVLIHDKNLERGQWQVGQKTSSSDDFQRSAKVRLPSRTLITRPRNLLYKFETENGKEHEGDQPNVSPETPTPTEKGHPMMTRSKTLLKNDVLKNDATLFTFIAILSHCDTVSASTRCPSELTLQKTIIYATNCASKGVAIAKHKLDGNDKLCWFPISCPFGAIQIPIPFHHNHAICVRKMSMSYVGNFLFVQHKSKNSIIKGFRNPVRDRIIHTFTRMLLSTILKM
ncbi:hypothetical protein RB195_014411 [Necator americanus]|uniref:Uncharacterized protein n=2 Tax=Necator americanus TaxID=51031 RepID=W2SXZ7_NECAM|nr:hypothetical protein NECAME_13517 [Necator americanus]ETN73482.1 hypothetical protein NECAME_13517 [Necator americanus]